MINVLHRQAETTTEFGGKAILPSCHACVVVPARNEQRRLPRTLEALRNQVDLQGEPLDPASFEVLLLLNNCTDESASVARRFAKMHPGFHVAIEEVRLTSEQAHVGTARKMLMDAACARLESQSFSTSVILSTDADTVVAPDWIARNLAHVEAGAEVVGGVINLLPGDLDLLDEGTRAAYLRDRHYQQLVARLESLLDPDPSDPWPRHLEHFGASLGCTCEVYRRSGGLPPVKPLEDVAFVDALRKVGARIRHAADVHIYTSARLDGRAEVGLSGQLRHWQRECAEGTPHVVDSAEWLAHRFRSLQALRVMNSRQEGAVDLQAWPVGWRQRLASLHAEGLQHGRFLELLDCNALIDETFAGPRHSEIDHALRALQGIIDDCSASR